MSSISVGVALHQLLSEDAEVKATAKKIFPVMTAEADLPYIHYRVTGMEQNPTKGADGADTVHVEVNCLDRTYGGAVSLAEKARKVLDHVSFRTDDGIYVRSCTLTGMDNSYEDDAYIVSLDFTVRVNQ